MPLVRAYIKSGDSHLPRDLRVACDQLIPAIYSTNLHPLTPGSIVWLPPALGSNSLKVNVLVEAEGFFYEDREKIIGDRALELKEYLKELFPGVTFVVWPKLVVAGWAADYVDPEFDGDLSMEAAMARAKASLGARHR